MKRRMSVLAALAILAIVATATVAFSRASFTSTSQSTLAASADTVGSWISVYSAQTDPLGPSGYSRQRNVLSNPFIATGEDAGLVIDWGGYPDNAHTREAYSRVLTIRTPATFPDASVSQVRVTVTVLPDASGRQPLDKAHLHLTPGAGHTSYVDMAPSTRAQLDVEMWIKKQWWGQGYVAHPHVLLTVTFAGQTVAYYVYDFASSLKII